jgi:hypothetical protein
MAAQGKTVLMATLLRMMTMSKKRLIKSSGEAPEMPKQVKIVKKLPDSRLGEYEPKPKSQHNAFWRFRVPELKSLQERIDIFLYELRKTA